VSRDKNGNKFPSLVAWGITKVCTTTYSVVHQDAKVLDEFENKLFDVNESHSGSISKQEWISHCESNRHLKHFLEFNCGDLITHIDILALANGSEEDKDKAMKQFINVYSPLIWDDPPASTTETPTASTTETPTASTTTQTSTQTTETTDEFLSLA